METPETPKKIKAYLALPTYADSMRRPFVMSLLDLLLFNPIPNVEWVIGTIGGDGIGRSRNNLVQNFLLTTECDVLFFIDVDIKKWGAKEVGRIVNALSKERPVIGGKYAAKQMKHRWIYTAIPGEEVDPKTGHLRVQESGTGIKGYHRSYFEDVMRAFPEIQYFCDGASGAQVKWDFFSMGVVNGRYLSEDYYADHRARLIGIPVYVDTLCEVSHQGFMDFPFKDNVEVFDGITIDTLMKMCELIQKNPEAAKLALGAFRPTSDECLDAEGLQILPRQLALT